MTASPGVLLREAAALQARGDLAGAERRYRSILRIDAGNFNALHLLGVVRIQQGRADEAVRLISQSLRANPRSAEAHSNLASALLHLGRHDEAAAAGEAAIALKPDYPQAHTHLGLALQGLGRLADAVDHHRRAIDLAPALATAHNNLGLALEAMNDRDAAAAAYRKAIALRPRFVDALVNLGNALQALGRFDDALACFETALSTAPDHARAHLAVGMAHLLRGDFAAGWREYEWRLRVPDATPDEGLPGRPWRGEPELRGRRILLYEEQGFGDTLQFVRYVPLLARAGARVVLETDPALARVAQDVDGVHALVVKGSRRPAVDFHCPLMSLPYALRTTAQGIPAEVPYLRVAAERQGAWRERLGPRRGLRVGVAWSGRRAHRNDRNRSIPLARLAPLFALPGIDYVTLQPDVRDGDDEALRAFPRVRHLGPLLCDFADTACVVAEIDLVIAVDTSVAHLAGALARPVWLMLPFAPEWRWMLGRADTPWYPTMRLWRQPRVDDWSGVIDAVAVALRERSGE